ncbi:MAG: lipopolysaccharide transport periplasmic protein LptA [Gammaproteobacteria bacterium]|nr:lipopolysaccharide transport periplasmic protein LptA [Gammaproteobacteria bacterium]
MALQSDRDQPIHLQADRVEINEKQATSVYQGNVHLQQGSLKIDADEVTVQMKQGRLDVIIIKGKPALLEQMPEKQDTPVRSRADYMEYFADEERLLLKSNAEVVQGQNLFRGDHIEYDTRNSMVRAHKDPSSDSRVHAVIQPGEKPLPATPLPDGPKPIP